MRKRILIPSGIGFLFGLLCLLQASGVFDWLPEGFFLPCIHRLCSWLDSVFTESAP